MAALYRERYLVTWTIDIEADSPEEAAAQALICQRDSESTAVVFSVLDKQTKVERVIDLNLGSEP